MTKSSTAWLTNGWKNGAGYRKSLTSFDVTAVVVASLFINLLSIAAPLTALLVYDKVLTNQAKSTLTVLAFGAMGLLAIEATLRICRSIIMTRASAHADFVGRNHVMRSVLHPKGAIPEDRTITDLNAKLAAVSTLRELRFARITMVIDLPFGLLFLVLVAAIGGWTVALPASVCAIFMLFLHAIAIKSANALRVAHGADRNRWRFLEHAARGLHGIAAVATQVPVADRFVRRQLDRAGAQAEQGYLDLFRRDVLAIFAQVLIGSVVVAGALAVLDEKLSLGGLAACTLLAGRALEPLQNCFHVASLSHAARVAREDLADLDPVPAAQPDEPWDSPPAISAHNCMVLGYDGVTPLISIPELHIKPGEIVCISGARGSGKSTLCRAIMGLAPTEGLLTVGGLAPDGDQGAVIRRQTSCLNRSQRLPAGSILHVLTGGSERLYADVRYLAHLVGLDRSIRRLTLGYDTQLGGEAIHQVPDGVRQQIAICRVLAQKRKLLIVDDLPAAIDANTLLRFADVLRKLSGTATVILFSDHPALLGLATRQFAISDRQLIETKQERAAS